MEEHLDPPHLRLVRREPVNRVLQFRRPRRVTSEATHFTRVLTRLELRAALLRRASELDMPHRGLWLIRNRLDDDRSR